MLVLYFLASSSLFECMRLTASGITRKEVCAYEKVCAYKKGVLNNPSLRYLFRHFTILLGRWNSSLLSPTPLFTYHSTIGCAPLFTFKSSLMPRLLRGRPGTHCLRMCLIYWHSGNPLGYSLYISCSSCHRMSKPQTIACYLNMTLTAFAMYHSLIKWF